jgi:hypothetical protein
MFITMSDTEDIRIFCEHNYLNTYMPVNENGVYVLVSCCMFTSINPISG